MIIGSGPIGTSAIADGGNSRVTESELSGIKTPNTATIKTLGYKKYVIDVHLQTEDTNLSCEPTPSTLVSKETGTVGKLQRIVNLIGDIRVEEPAKIESETDVIRFVTGMKAAPSPIIDTLLYKIFPAECSLETLIASVACAPRAPPLQANSASFGGLVIRQSNSVKTDLEAEIARSPFCKDDFTYCPRLLALIRLDIEFNAAPISLKYDKISIKRFVYADIDNIIDPLHNPIKDVELRRIIKVDAKIISESTTVISHVTDSKLVATGNAETTGDMYHISHCDANIVIADDHKLIKGLAYKINDVIAPIKSVIPDDFSVIECDMRRFIMVKANITPELAIIEAAIEPSILQADHASTPSLLSRGSMSDKDELEAGAAITPSLLSRGSDVENGELISVNEVEPLKYHIDVIRNIIGHIIPEVGTITSFPDASNMLAGNPTFTGVIARMSNVVDSIVYKETEQEATTIPSKVSHGYNIDSELQADNANAIVDHSISLLSRGSNLDGNVNAEFAITQSFPVGSELTASNATTTSLLSRGSVSDNDELKAEAGYPYFEFMININAVLYSENTTLNSYIDDNKVTASMNRIVPLMGTLISTNTVLISYVDDSILKARPITIDADIRRMSYVVDSIVYKKTEQEATTSPSELSHGYNINSECISDDANTSDIESTSFLERGSNIIGNIQSNEAQCNSYPEPSSLVVSDATSSGLLYNSYVINSELKAIDDVSIGGLLYKKYNIVDELVSDDSSTNTVHSTSLLRRGSNTDGDVKSDIAILTSTPEESDTSVEFATMYGEASRGSNIVRGMIIENTAIIGFADRTVSIMGVMQSQNAYIICYPTYNTLQSINYMKRYMQMHYREIIQDTPEYPWSIIDNGYYQFNSFVGLPEFTTSQISFYVNPNDTVYLEFDVKTPQFDLEYFVVLVDDVKVFSSNSLKNDKEYAQLEFDVSSYITEEEIVDETDDGTLSEFTVSDFSVTTSSLESGTDSDPSEETPSTEEETGVKITLQYQRFRDSLEDTVSVRNIHIVETIKASSLTTGLVYKIEEIHDSIAIPNNAEIDGFGSRYSLLTGHLLSDVGSMISTPVSNELMSEHATSYALGYYITHLMGINRPFELTLLDAVQYTPETPWQIVKYGNTYVGTSYTENTSVSELFFDLSFNNNSNMILSLYWDIQEKHPGINDFSIIYDNVVEYTSFGKNITNDYIRLYVPATVNDIILRHYRNDETNASVTSLRDFSITTAQQSSATIDGVFEITSLLYGYNNIIVGDYTDRYRSLRKRQLIQDTPDYPWSIYDAGTGYIKCNSFIGLPAFTHSQVSFVIEHDSTLYFEWSINSPKYDLEYFTVLVDDETVFYANSALVNDGVFQYSIPVLENSKVSLKYQRFSNTLNDYVNVNSISILRNVYSTAEIDGLLYKVEYLHDGISPALDATIKGIGERKRNVFGNIEAATGTLYSEPEHNELKSSPVSIDTLIYKHNYLDGIQTPFKYTLEHAIQKTPSAPWTIEYQDYKYVATSYKGTCNYSELLFDLSPGSPEEYILTLSWDIQEQFVNTTDFNILFDGEVVYESFNLVYADIALTIPANVINVVLQFHKEDSQDNSAISIRELSISHVYQYSATLQCNMYIKRFIEEDLNAEYSIFSAIPDGSELTGADADVATVTGLLHHYHQIDGISIPRNAKMHGFGKVIYTINGKLQSSESEIVSIPANSNLKGQNSQFGGLIYVIHEIVSGVSGESIQAYTSGLGVKGPIIDDELEADDAIIIGDGYPKTNVLGKIKADDSYVYGFGVVTFFVVASIDSDLATIISHPLANDITASNGSIDADMIRKIIMFGNLYAYAEHPFTKTVRYYEIIQDTPEYPWNVYLPSTSDTWWSPGREHTIDSMSYSGLPRNTYSQISFFIQDKTTVELDWKVLSPKFKFEYFVILVDDVAIFTSDSAFDDSDYVTFTYYNDTDEEQKISLRYQRFENTRQDVAYVKNIKVTRNKLLGATIDSRLPHGRTIFDELVVDVASTQGVFARQSNIIGDIVADNAILSFIPEPSNMLALHAIVDADVQRSIMLNGLCRYVPFTLKDAEKIPGLEWTFIGNDNNYIGTSGAGIGVSSEIIFQLHSMLPLYSICFEWDLQDGQYNNDHLVARTSYYSNNELFSEIIFDSNDSEDNFGYVCVDYENYFGTKLIIGHYRENPYNISKTSIRDLKIIPQNTRYATTNSLFSHGINLQLAWYASPTILEYDIDVIRFAAGNLIADDTNLISYPEHNNLVSGINTLQCNARRIVNIVKADLFACDFYDVHDLIEYDVSLLFNNCKNWTSPKDIILANKSAYVAVNRWSYTITDDEGNDEIMWEVDWYNTQISYTIPSCAEIKIEYHFEDTGELLEYVDRKYAAVNIPGEPSYALSIDPSGNGTFYYYNTSFTELELTITLEYRQRVSTSAFSFVGYYTLCRINTNNVVLTKYYRYPPRKIGIYDHLTTHDNYRVQLNNNTYYNLFPKTFKLLTRKHPDNTDAPIFNTGLTTPPVAWDESNNFTTYVNPHEEISFEYDFFDLVLLKGLDMDSNTFPSNLNIQRKLQVQIRNRKADNIYGNITDYVLCTRPYKGYYVYHNASDETVMFKIHIVPTVISGDVDIPPEYYDTIVKLAEFTITTWKSVYYDQYHFESYYVPIWRIYDKYPYTYINFDTPSKPWKELENYDWDGTRDSSYQTLHSDLNLPEQSFSQISFQPKPGWDLFFEYDVYSPRLNIDYFSVYFLYDTVHNKEWTIVSDDHLLGVESQYIECDWEKFPHNAFEYAEYSYPNMPLIKNAVKYKPFLLGASDGSSVFDTTIHVSTVYIKTFRTLQLNYKVVATEHFNRYGIAVTASVNGVRQHRNYIQRDYLYTEYTTLTFDASTDFTDNEIEISLHYDLSVLKATAPDITEVQVPELIIHDARVLTEVNVKDYTTSDNRVTFTQLYTNAYLQEEHIWKIREYVVRSSSTRRIYRYYPSHNDELGYPYNTASPTIYWMPPYSEFRCDYSFTTHVTSNVGYFVIRVIRSNNSTITRLVNTRYSRSNPFVYYNNNNYDVGIEFSVNYQITSIEDEHGKHMASYTVTDPRHIRYDQTIMENFRWSSDYRPRFAKSNGNPKFIIRYDSHEIANDPNSSLSYHAKIYKLSYVRPECICATIISYPDPPNLQAGHATLSTIGGVIHGKHYVTGLKAPYLQYLPTDYVPTDRCDWTASYVNRVSAINSSHFACDVSEFLLYYPDWLYYPTMMFRWDITNLKEGDWFDVLLGDRVLFDTREIATYIARLAYLNNAGYMPESEIVTYLRSDGASGGNVIISLPDNNFNENLRFRHHKAHFFNNSVTSVSKFLIKERFELVAKINATVNVSRILTVNLHAGRPYVYNQLLVNDEKLGYGYFGADGASAKVWQEGFEIIGDIDSGRAKARPIAVLNGLIEATFHIKTGYPGYQSWYIYPDLMIQHTPNCPWMYDDVENIYYSCPDIEANSYSQLEFIISGSNDILRFEWKVMSPMFDLDYLQVQIGPHIVLLASALQYDPDIWHEFEYKIRRVNDVAIVFTYNRFNNTNIDQAFIRNLRLDHEVIIQSSMDGLLYHIHDEDWRIISGYATTDCVLAKVEKIVGELEANDAILESYVDDSKLIAQSGHFNDSALLTWKNLTGIITEWKVKEEDLIFDTFCSWTSLYTRNGRLIITSADDNNCQVSLVRYSIWNTYFDNVLLFELDSDLHEGDHFRIYADTILIFDVSDIKTNNHTYMVDIKQSQHIIFEHYKFNLPNDSQTSIKDLRIIQSHRFAKINAEFYIVNAYVNAGITAGGATIDTIIADNEIHADPAVLDDSLIYRLIQLNGIYPAFELGRPIKPAVTLNYNWHYAITHTYGIKPSDVLFYEDFPAGTSPEDSLPEWHVDSTRDRWNIYYDNEGDVKYDLIKYNKSKYAAFFLVLDDHEDLDREVSVAFDYSKRVDGFSIISNTVKVSPYINFTDSRTHTFFSRTTAGNEYVYRSSELVGISNDSFVIDSGNKTYIVFDYFDETDDVGEINPYYSLRNIIISETVYESTFNENYDYIVSKPETRNNSYMQSYYSNDVLMQSFFVKTDIEDCNMKFRFDLKINMNLGGTLVGGTIVGGTLVNADTFYDYLLVKVHSGTVKTIFDTRDTVYQPLWVNNNLYQTVLLYEILTPDVEYVEFQLFTARGTTTEIEITNLRLLPGVRPNNQIARINAGVVINAHVELYDGITVKQHAILDYVIEHTEYVPKTYHIDNELKAGLAIINADVLLELKILINGIYNVRFATIDIGEIIHNRHILLDGDLAAGNAYGTEVAYPISMNNYIIPLDLQRQWHIYELWDAPTLEYMIYADADDFGRIGDLVPRLFTVLVEAKMYYRLRVTYEYSLEQTTPRNIGVAGVYGDQYNYISSTIKSDEVYYDSHINRTDLDYTHPAGNIRSYNWTEHSDLVYGQSMIEFEYFFNMLPISSIKASVRNITLYMTQYYHGAYINATFIQHKELDLDLKAGGATLDWNPKITWNLSFDIYAGEAVLRDGLRNNVLRAKHATINSTTEITHNLIGNIYAAKSECNNKEEKILTYSDIIFPDNYRLSWVYTRFNDEMVLTSGSRTFINGQYYNRYFEFTDDVTSTQTIDHRLRTRQVIVSFDYSLEKTSVSRKTVIDINAENNYKNVNFKLNSIDDYTFEPTDRGEYIENLSPSTGGSAENEFNFAPWVGDAILFYDMKQAADILNVYLDDELITSTDGYTESTGRLYFYYPGNGIIKVEVIEGTPDTVLWEPEWEYSDWEYKIERFESYSVEYNTSSPITVTFTHSDPWIKPRIKNLKVVTYDCFRPKFVEIDAYVIRRSSDNIESERAKLDNTVYKKYEGFGALVQDSAYITCVPDNNSLVAGKTHIDAYVVHMPTWNVKLYAGGAKITGYNFVLHWLYAARIQAGNAELNGKLYRYMEAMGDLQADNANLISTVEPSKLVADDTDITGDMYKIFYIDEMSVDDRAIIKGFGIHTIVINAELTAGHATFHNKLLPNELYAGYATLYGVLSMYKFGWGDLVVGDGLSGMYTIPVTDFAQLTPLVPWFVLNTNGEQCITAGKGVPQGFETKVSFTFPGKSILSLEWDVITPYVDPDMFRILVDGTLILEESSVTDNIGFRSFRYKNDTDDPMTVVLTYTKGTQTRVNRVVVKQVTYEYITPATMKGNGSVNGETIE